jgi:phosphoglycerate dehydrogenase-like enzyme
VVVQPHVLVTWQGFPGSAGAELLDAEGIPWRLEAKLGEQTAEDVIGIVGDAVAVIASTDPFTAEVFASCPSLRLIARVGVGYDAIDVAAASAAGVAVTTTPGANSSSVADHALGLMLAVIRRIAEQDAAVRDGRWPRDTEDLASELTGRTAGLVGYGAIGRMVGRRLAGFDVEVLAHDPVYDGGDLAAPVSLDELLARSTVVSLHAPLVPATHHLIAGPQLARMRPDAILINTARGGLVDEEALLEALTDGTIAGAGLDVFAEEPPPADRFRDLRNVVLTPHLAGLSDRSRQAMTRLAAESVVDLLAGRRPRGTINPIDWHTWHEAYLDPASGLAQRLEAVKGEIGAELAARTPPLTAISLCAGTGEDLIGALAEHPEHVGMRALLVELDAGLAARAREAAAAAGLTGIEVAEADAAASDRYADHAPADLVLLCGVLGNMTGADAERTVRAMTQLVREGGALIWTRNRKPPDATPAIRGWLAEAGFEEASFTSPGPSRFSVGRHILRRPPDPLEHGAHWFTFTR